MFYALARKATRVILCVIVVLIGYATATQAATEPKSPGLRYITLPCTLDGSELGEVDSVIDAANHLVSISDEPILEWLKPVVLPAYIDRLQERMNGKHELTVQDISSTGLGLEYDTTQLELRLIVPVEARKRVDLHLGGGRSERAEPGVLNASDVSAYLNFRGAREYLAGTRNGWQPLILDFDGATTILGTTFEGIATYRGPSAFAMDSGWSRGDLRLVRDFPNTRLRVSAGDVSYGLDGFQGFRRIGGISVGRDFGLQPYRSSAPSGLTSLMLDRRSRVDVIVNGQRVESLTLAPGQYNVRDFPFASGPNDVSLRITDEVGRIQTVNFPFVYDATVLGRGEHDFHYAAGFAATPTAHGRKYAKDQVLGSFFHAVGITDQVTVGANFQADSDERIGGLEARWAAPFGTLRLDAAGSIVSGIKNGYALRLSYRYVGVSNAQSTGRSVEFTSVYRSPTFATFGVAQPVNPVALDFGVRYGQRLFGKLYGSLGFSYQRGRQGLRDSRSIDAGLSTSFSESLNVYLLAGRARHSSGRSETRVFLAVSWFPVGSNHSVTASRDTRSHDNQLQWHYTPRHNVHSFEADAVAERTHLQDQFRAEAEYKGYRFTTSVFQSSILDRTGTSGDQHSTTLRLGSALAFADGHIGVSRPITDSFAIISPHRALKGHPVDVNPYSGRADAQTGLLGPAVLPDLAS